jgi:hypothetical protein
MSRDLALVNTNKLESIKSLSKGKKHHNLTYKN